jgi:hypothetical protein
MLDPDELKKVFHHTEIVRRPRYGIVSGYHELPYICLGHSEERGKATTEIRGKIRVSPRFLIVPKHYEPHYEDVFGEDNVDAQLMGRVFGFVGFRDRPVECRSEHLSVSYQEPPLQEVLGGVLDELERFEDIKTGVIITPDSRYYPVSIERFISTILDDEFST